MEFTADELLSLASDDVASVTAEYYPAFGVEGLDEIDWDTGFSVPGWFSKPYRGIDLGDMDVASSDPRFICREEDLPGESHKDDRLFVSGQLWRVTNPQPDGAGMVALILKKA